MADIFSGAKFITTEFQNYCNPKNLPWGMGRSKLYQHTDLISWEGLPMFACDFEAEKTDNARIYFSALGCVDIYINGERAGTGEMKPGWSDYNTRAFYTDYDISALLKNGRNRILAVAAPGWYSGRIAGGYYGDGTPSVMISIKANGKDIVNTDAGWKCTVGGRIRTADIWDGEYCDATEAGYDEMSRTDFDISGWDSAQIFEYKGKVTEFIGPEIRIRKELILSPANIKVYDGINYNGTYFGCINVCNGDAALPLEVKKGQKVIVDFGQETVGHLYIKAKSKKGTELKMRYAEFLNDSGEPERGNDGPKGSVYTVNLRSALGKAYYVFGSDETEEYRPVFTFFGYRYVEISAENDMTIYDLKAEPIGNDTEETGKIETSDPLVNRLISNALWGQRGNYVSVPTDCPQRDERLGWTGDAQAFSITAAYNADVYGFFRKWMQDMRDSQSESGGYADVNPRVGCCHSEDACAWGDAGVIIPYNLYMIYGDDTMIKEHFDSMDKYITGLEKKYGYSGPIPRYGDWLAYDWCSNEFISSAYFNHDIDLMIYMSKIAGREDRLPYYRELKVKAHKYFEDNFMKDGKLIGQTQCDKIISLAFDLLDENYAKEVADELEEQIKENGDRLSCGFLGTYNLCPTLSKYGKDKTAYNLLLQRNEPSWLYSIDQGATTIWERWNSYTVKDGFGDVGMNSFNHYAYGSVCEWMYRYMAGIEPDEPGFSKIRLDPRIDLRTENELPAGQKNITFVKAEFKSAAGLIKSEWNTENGFVYKCSVPSGAKARLSLPVLSDSLTMNGREAEAVIKDGKYILDLDGGEYAFTE
ncbi:MAG: glycoside hydrolase family 78 protein [Clostridia bacterium]|nr:glycoside hydrolase family 78 protein [Clostridia bacterium]